MSRTRKPKIVTLLNDAEKRDIKLWFAWGNIYDYPTSPRDYLRAMLKPDMRARFLEQPRAKRKAILRFVIEEHAWRRIPRCPAPVK